MMSSLHSCVKNNWDEIKQCYITDSSNGKKYVGSATGENMIWGRWKDYIANGNGGNIELKSLDFEYIQKNFRYSILEIYKSTTDDDAILERESWWKSS